jgi:small nuclear ribonucleoprotein (snRNP)-like protein
MNLVLDEVKEFMRGMFVLFASPVFRCIPRTQCTNVMGPTDDEGNEETRNLGLVVARGTLLTMISPVDGSEEIENPFLTTEEE